MGCNIFLRSCDTNCVANAPAPNPDPKRWELLDVAEYEHAYVLLVKYLDATNFEGVKVMVYTGKFPDISQVNHLDPHFCEDGISPIARFRPDNEGKFLACELAAKLSERMKRKS